jgi:Fic family protein
MEYNDVLDYWREQHIDTRAKLECTLDHYRILFAYHSGKIENDAVDYHDTREIFANGSVSGYTGDLRALFEQRNQRTCYYFLLDRVVAKKPIDKALVKEVHAILTAGTYDEHTYIDNEERPGDFKKHDYVIGIEDTGYSPEDVEAGIDSLLVEINGDDGDVLTKAAYFHAMFEYIHPFADGNGRVGRTLLNYYLMTHNYPPTIIFAEEKTAYSIALEVFDAVENIEPLKKIVIDGTIKAWEGRIRRNVTVSPQPATQK